MPDALVPAISCPRYRLGGPSPWRSEFRNVLRGYMAGGYMTFAEAIAIARDAEADLADQTYEVNTGDVFRLVDASGHSAYDCEYVALAQTPDVPLVTGDRRLPDLFPETAVLLKEFAEETDDSSN